MTRDHLQRRFTARLALSAFMVLALMALAACSSADESTAESEDAALPDLSDAADTSDAGQPMVTCEAACKRAPRCEPDLTDEIGCLANCYQSGDAELFACCIQYAAGCSEVSQCVTGVKRECNPTGEPWIPIPMFGECECTDGTSMPDDMRECKVTSPDHPCETGTCIKPRNMAPPAFCAVDCTDNADICPEGTTCKTTPQSWYCVPK